MKQKALTLAIKRIFLAELALSAAMAAPAFAQSQPAAPESNPAATGTGNSPAVPGGKAAASSGSVPSNTAETGASGKKVTQMKRFEVTGSLIRSSDKTGFNQVQSVTQKDIQNSGATTTANYLRNSSVNSASSYSEDTVLVQSPGGVGVALRGLSMKYTLTLIDGQRAAPYARAQGGTDTFFDINTIPSNMIDHIEIVKTGAVSQYGSDAIAGVINVITKHDFQGLELNGSLGGAQDGGQATQTFGVLGGFGDINADRFNVTAAANYYNASGVTMSQRDITANEDYSGLPGGFFSQPSSFFATPSGPQALNPCGPTGKVTSAANNLETQTPGTVCSQNGAWAQDLAPQVMHSNAKVHADFKINDNLQAYADFWGSYDTTRLATGLAGFGPSALVPSLIEDPVNGYQPFAPTVGGNPLTFYFPVKQDVDTTAVFYRASTGLTGSFNTAKLGTWDWSTSYGHSQSEVSSSYTNQVNASVVQSYLNGVTPDTFSAATLANLPGALGTAYDSGVSKLDTVDATISTPNLFKLPAGDVGVGFGAQFQHQSEYLGGSSIAYVNPYTQAVDGERNIAAVYYQVDIPILRNLTFSQSGRYDHYDDFGGVFSPRFALRYQPVRAMTMYASYDRGFRAPTLLELYGKGSTSFQTIEGTNVNEYFQGNPNLEPEHTRNYNLGFELSPTRYTDIGVDWYKIDVSNVIGQGNIVAAYNANPGQPIYNVGYTNFSYLHTDGFETTFRQSVPTKVGTFTLSGDWAYVWHFVMPMGTGIASDFAGTNLANDTVFGGAFPRWKGNTSLSWDWHKWLATLTWQFTGPYAQAIDPGSNVGSYSVFNLMVTYTGIKHWTIYAGVNDLFNRQPPFDPVWMYTYRGYFDPSVYSDIGRYGQIGAIYKF
jgi:iron complex outermembrane recepter protein